jgi:hypothetical protein
VQSCLKYNAVMPRKGTAMAAQKRQPTRCEIIEILDARILFALNELQISREEGVSLSRLLERARTQAEILPSGLGLPDLRAARRETRQYLEAMIEQICSKD